MAQRTLLDACKKSLLTVAQRNDEKLAGRKSIYPENNKTARELQRAQCIQLEIQSSNRLGVQCPSLATAFCFHCRFLQDSFQRK